MLRSRPWRSKLDNCVSLAPRGSKTPERISVELGIYNYVGGMTTHTNPYGAATTWVVSANT